MGRCQIAGVNWRLAILLFGLCVIFTVLTTLVGLCAGPLFVGVLSDFMQVRFGDESLRYSLLVPTAAPLFSALICIFGARRVAADLARARAGRASA